MIIRAMLAATAALFCFSAQVQGQAMNAANGDPLPRGKAEEVGMSSERLGEIEKIIKADIEKGRLPGAVIAVARKGKLVYYEAFGFRDKAAGVAMTQDTIFNIASMTKPMAALAALQLYERGKLLIDDPLSKYFPNSPRWRSRSSTRRARRSPTRSRQAADHAAPSDDAHLRPGLWRARQHRRAQALSGRQQLAGGRWTARDSWTSSRSCRCCTSRARCGTMASGSICSDRSSRRSRGRPSGIFRGKHHKAARHERHGVLHSAREGRTLRPGAADRSRHRPGADRRAGADAAAEVRMRRRLPVVDGGRLHALRADAAEQGHLWRDAHSRPQDRRIHADQPDRPGGEEPDRNADPTRADYGFGLGLAVRTEAGRGKLLGSVGDFNWPGASGTNWWADPKEDLAVVFMAHSPGPIRWHYRQVINALVYQAIVD